MICKLQSIIIYNEVVIYNGIVIYLCINLTIPLVINTLRVRNNSSSSAKWQVKMGNWHAKKYDGQMKGEIEAIIFLDCQNEF